MPTPYSSSFGWSFLNRQEAGAGSHVVYKYILLYHAQVTLFIAITHNNKLINILIS